MKRLYSGDMKILLEESHNIPNDTDENKFKKNLTQSFIEALIKKLDKRNKKIVIERFGLFECPKRKLSDLSKKFSVTTERIRQYEHIALRIMTKPQNIEEALQSASIQNYKDIKDTEAIIFSDLSQE